jgi:hypothetical protein
MLHHKAALKLLPFGRFLHTLLSSLNHEIEHGQLLQDLGWTLLPQDQSVGQCALGMQAGVAPAKEVAGRFSGFHQGWGCASRFLFFGGGRVAGGLVAPGAQALLH